MAKLKRLSPLEKAVFIIVTVLFAVYALTLLYPFFFAIRGSLRESGRGFDLNPMAFPEKPNFANYINAFKELEINDNNFFEMTLNSLWFAGGSTVISIFCSACTAYVVCKYNFVGRRFLYALAIATMMIPIYGSLPATYKLYDKLGMLNSPMILLSATGGFGYNFVIGYAFFKGISWSYAEAAFIDGASHAKVFFKIMLPMVMPALTALLVTGFVGAWNNYESPLLYFEEMPTLASGLWAYEEKSKYNANQPVYFAGVMISLIPVITLFLIFQNTIMTNVYAGGLKG